MKVGIMTFHRALNYGAFLQAFSLKSYLESLNCQVDIIDYWPEEHFDMYSLFSFKQIRSRSFLFSLKYVIYRALCSTRLWKRKKKMMKLWKTYFGIDKDISYKTPYCLSSLEYDCLIYGSDQIWWKWNNRSDGLFDWTYWGDFVPKSIKKVSYAASMGAIEPNDSEKKEIAQRLENFQSISVREKQLQRLIQSLTEKKVFHVIDPVFLTSKEIWERFAKVPPISKKYVLLFNLMNSAEAEIIAKRKAKSLCCDLIEITASVKPLKVGKWVYQTLDAFEFIGFIKKAEFVVTSSFHGTAFSIIFRKQFLFVGNGKNLGRVTSLLETLNISDRLIKIGGKEPVNPIDYMCVNNLLENEVNQSIDFLSKSLKKNADF